MYSLESIPSFVRSISIRAVLPGEANVNCSSNSYHLGKEHNNNNTGYVSPTSRQTIGGFVKLGALFS